MLSIIVPVYNEEAALEEVLGAMFDARKFLLSKKTCNDVEIVVVNDGSSDGTQKILKAIQGIKIIEHAKNMGYGASLKEGFREARGDILAFLDADGTYNPRELAKLVHVLQDHNADMVIGNRMHKGSRMPLVRKIGNRIFAKIISIAAKTPVSDVTSGMRIFRREILERLVPLPDGLDFTTVMTAKAVLEQKLEVLWVPISYSERTGTSKLNVLRDGPRVLWKLLVICTRRTYTHRVGCL